MKKIVALLLAVVMCCGMLVGCGEKEEKVPDKVESASEEKEVEEKNPEEIKKEVEVEREVEESEEEKEEIGMELNSPFEVNTENGNYILTINEVLSLPPEGLSDVPEGMKIAIVVYTVKNIDYDDSLGGVFIDDNVIKLADENKSMLQTYGLIPGEYQHPDMVMPGYEQKAALSYLIGENTTTVDVVINRYSEISGNLTVEMK